jgi:hypothetical protein
VVISLRGGMTENSKKKDMTKNRRDDKAARI